MAAISSLLALGVMAWSNGAAAVPIDTDLTITGSVELSTSLSVSPFSDGNVTQSGTIRRTTGGATTSNGFSTTPGTADSTNDATTTLPANNPLSATLTDTGDGFGYGTVLDSAFETGFGFNEGFDFVIDLGIDIANTSLTDTFTITMRVDFSHTASASGSDSYGESRLDLERNAVDVRTSEVGSDTLLGDTLNGTGLGTNGAVVTDGDTFFFDVVVGASSAADVGVIHQWEGGVFNSPGNSLIDVTFDIIISNVSCSGPNCATTSDPDPIPEPGTLTLLALGLSGMATLRHRQRRRRRQG